MSRMNRISCLIWLAFSANFYEKYNLAENSWLTKLDLSLAQLSLSLLLLLLADYYKW